MKKPRKFTEHEDFGNPFNFNKKDERSSPEEQKRFEEEFLKISIDFEEKILKQMEQLNKIVEDTEEGMLKNAKNKRRTSQ